MTRKKKFEYASLGKRWAEDDVQFIILTPCHTCKHRTGPLTCAAFKLRIPITILEGGHLHREPYPGDHGIQYEPKQP